MRFDHAEPTDTATEALREAFKRRVDPRGQRVWVVELENLYTVNGGILPHGVRVWCVVAKDEPCVDANPGSDPKRDVFLTAVGIGLLLAFLLGLALTIAYPNSIGAALTAPLR